MISTVLVGGSHAHTQAQVPAPTFTLVDSGGYSVNGDGWTDGMATVELIAPDSTSSSSSVPVVGNQFWENLDVPEDFGPGWSVVVTGVDEGETSSLALPLLTVDRVDTSIGKVGGTANPGLQFTARSCTDGSEPCTEVEVVDNASGQWISPVLPVNDRRIDARYFDPEGGGALEIQYLWPSLVYQRYQQYPDLGQQLSAWNFPPNVQISITVDDPDDTFDQTVLGQTDGDGNWSLDLAGPQMDSPIEDSTIVGSNWKFRGETVVDGWVMSKELTGIDLTIDTVDQIDDDDPSTGSAAGTCSAGFVIQLEISRGLWFTGDSEHREPTCTPQGTWAASWALDETGVPEISAYSSEVDNDGFGVRRARPSLSLGNDGVNPLQLGFHAWNMSEESTLTITDESGAPVWSGMINEYVVAMAGESGRYDLSLDKVMDTTPVNEGWTFRVASATQLKSVVAETVTIDLRADGTASLNESGEVTGTASPNRHLIVYVNGGEFETWSDDTGAWTAGGGLDGVGEVAAWMTDRDGDAVTVEAGSDPAPARQIDANPELDTVAAWQSEAGLWLTVERGDPLGEVYPLDQYSGFTDQQMFNLREEGFDLRPADVVTVTDGTSTKQHEVVALSFDELNAAEDFARGTAPGGSVVVVGVGNQSGGFEFEVDALGDPDQPSGWYADFGAQGFPISEDMGGRARVFDDDGDATTVYSGGGSHASLQVGIGPFATGIAGFGFQPGEPITVTVDDPDTAEAPDYSWRIPDDFPDGGADVFDGNFQLHAPFSDGENPVVLETGDIVTATDGVLTLSHTVRYVEFTGVDAESDTVTGLATPGEMLDVSWGNPEQWRSEQQHVTLDACGETETDCDRGTWTVDLTEMGGFLDGDSGGISVSDEHGSQTILMWGAPFIGASIDQDYGLYDAIWGAFWYLDNQVTVTVWDSDEDITDNPDDAKFQFTYDVEKHHWNGFGSDNFHANPTDVVAGNIVVAEGLQTGTVTTHEVLDLVVEGWENAAPDTDPPGGNRVFGTAQPVGPFDFVRVGVFAEPAGDGMRFADIDPGTGAWEVDFYDNPVEGEYGDGIEIQFGVNGSVELRGPNGNLTSARWGTHEGGGPEGPAIEVDPVDDIIYLYGYDDPTTFELTLNGASLVPQPPPGEGGDPGDGEDPEEDDGRSVFIFDVHPTDVHTGDIVTLSMDEQEVRRHTVTDVTVTDLVGSKVFGTASPLGVVAIDAHSGEEESGAHRFVVADVDGTWSADFGVTPERGAGDGIINDFTAVRTSITVRELDDDGDSTVISIGENVVGMFVVPDLDLVMTSDWSGLAPVSIEVEGETFDFDLERGPDMVSFGGFDFPDPMSWYVLAELPIDLVPGQEVTATDGIISISHVIRDIRVDEADTSLDTVSGYGEPPQVVAFLIDDDGGAGVGFTELPEAGLWTVDLIDASSETEQPYNLQHFDGTGIALVPEEDDGVGPDNATAALWDMAPHITELDLPADPARIESGVADVALHAAFTDIEFPDTHTASIDWGDGSVTTPTLAGGQRPGTGGTIDTDHAYATPGVYRVVLTVTDDGDSVTRAEFQYVVVYDPSAGSAIGNGKWETDDGTLVSEAKFGYNIKYKQDSTTPDGNFKFTYKSESNDTETEWKFEADTLNYLAIYNEWAQFAGTGSLDHGGGTFDFKVTMVDGDQPGGGDDDLIRVQIWDETGMLYDNQAGDSDDAHPTAGIDKGEIKISPKGGTSPR